MVFDQFIVASDAARYFNIIHDGIDAIRHIARSLNPDTGEALEIPNGEDQVAYIRTVINSIATAALANHVKLNDYATKIGITTISTYITNIFSIDVTQLQSELSTMRIISQYIINNIATFNTLTALENLALYIDANVSQWKSIRRSWAL